MPDSTPVRKAPGKADPLDAAPRIEDMAPDPDDSLASMLAEDSLAPAAEPAEDLLAEQETILIHIVRDGFTVCGRVWYRGQEIEFTRGTQAYEDTKNRHGESWLDMTQGDQMRRYGDIMFQIGPWPGSDYDNDRAAEAERKRGRSAPSIAQVAGPQRSTN